jgi:hypothetical protein
VTIAIRLTWYIIDIVSSVTVSSVILVYLSVYSSFAFVWVLLNLFGL